MEGFVHFPYSPSLAPTDFHLFTPMKEWHFDDEKELQNVMKDWIHAQMAEIYEERIY